MLWAELVLAILELLVSLPGFPELAPLLMSCDLWVQVLLAGLRSMHPGLC